MAYTRLDLKNDTVLTEDHLKHIEDGIVEAGRNSVKEYQRLTYFTIDVECTQPQTTMFGAVSVNTAPYANKVYKDNCVLYLPATYTTSGSPVKLVIYCKQGSSQITGSSNPIEGLKIFNYLISLGYAVLGVDGMPDGLVSELQLDDTRVVGNYVAARATSLAYEYVVNNYNIDSNGCFIFGYSQGGHYAQNVVDLTPIPILAVAEMSPVCSMRYHQWDLKNTRTIGGVSFTRPGRLNIARLFGFPTVTNDTELTNLEYNPMNVAGYDPWTRNVINPYTDFVQQSNGLWKLPDGVDLEDIKMVKFTRAPLKIWCAENDTALGCDVMKVYIKAIKNAGQIADIRVYSTGGHGIHSQQSAIGTFTENGKSHNLIPIAYEIAQWFNNFGGYLPTTTVSLSNKPTTYTPDINLTFKPSYKITYNLSIGGSYSGTTIVPENETYVSTITIADGYSLSGNIEVLMGGTSVANAVSVSGNTITINIASVTDDVEINANFINSTTGGISYALPLTQAMTSVVDGENFYTTSTNTKRMTSVSTSTATGILVPKGKSIVINGISGLRMDYIYGTSAGPGSSDKTANWGCIGTASEFVASNYFPYNTDGSLDSITITNNYEDDYYFFFQFAGPNKSETILVSDYYGKIIYSVES